MTPVEQIKEDIKGYKALIADGKAMEKMSGTEEFERIFIKNFVENYRDTSAHNVWMFNREQTEGYIHHIKARSIFKRYIAEVIELGQDAEQALLEAEAELKEEQELALNPEGE